MNNHKLESGSLYKLTSGKWVRLLKIPQSITTLTDACKWYYGKDIDDEGDYESQELAYLKADYEE